jgi:hypothetical protein
MQRADAQKEDYRGWPLRQRLEVWAFEAGPAGLVKRSGDSL